MNCNRIVNCRGCVQLIPKRVLGEVPSPCDSQLDSIMKMDESIYNEIESLEHVSGRSKVN